MNLHSIKISDAAGREANLEISEQAFRIIKAMQTEIEIGRVKIRDLEIIADTNYRAYTSLSNRVALGKCTEEEDM